MCLSESKQRRSSRDSSVKVTLKVSSIVEMFLLLTFVCCFACIEGKGVAPVPTKSVNICSAVINVVYKAPESGQLAFDGEVNGRYGLTSRVEAEQGKVVHLVNEMGHNTGCSPAVNTPKHGQWIALVQRGGCRFADKIHNAAMLNNASAVVVYNNRDEEEMITMNHDVDGVVSVFIQKNAGDHIASMVDRGLDVFMNISIGIVTLYEERASSAVAPSSTTNTPVLVLSLLIIVILIVGLVLLLVYGIRRSRRNSGGNSAPHRVPSVNIQQRQIAPRNVVFMPSEPFSLRAGLLEDIVEEPISEDTNPAA